MSSKRWVRINGWLEHYRTGTNRILTVLTFFSLVTLSLSIASPTKQFFSSVAPLVNIFTIISLSLDVASFLHFVVVKLANIDATISKVDRGTEQISRLVFKEKVSKFDSGLAAYQHIKDVIEERKNSINTVYSTAVQQCGKSLKEYRDYFHFLYSQFYGTSEPSVGIVLKSIVSFASDEDPDQNSKSLFRMCFEPLFNFTAHSGAIRKDSNIVFWFIPANLDVPFVNYTLLQYRDNSCESIWGWYVGQFSREKAPAKDDDFDNLLKSEVFARTQSQIIFDGFKSQFDLTRYNWEKTLAKSTSPKIEVDYSSTQESIKKKLKDLMIDQMNTKLTNRQGVR